MSKAVLASLKPYFYYLVGEDIKIVEVRKTYPKAEDWSKETYFYMSRDEKSFAKIPKEFQEKYRKHFGKVGLRFVCDRIIDIPYSQYFVDYYHTMPQNDLEETCLDMGHIDEYLLSKNGYGWHISNLVIYERPRGLSEFHKPCICKGEYEGEEYCDCISCDLAGDSDYGIIACDRKITRPPQSWCYVEEVER